MMVWCGKRRTKTKGKERKRKVRRNDGRTTTPLSRTDDGRTSERASEDAKGLGCVLWVVLKEERREETRKGKESAKVEREGREGREGGRERDGSCMHACAARWEDRRKG